VPTADPTHSEARASSAGAEAMAGGCEVKGPSMGATSITAGSTPKRASTARWSSCVHDTDDPVNGYHAAPSSWGSGPTGVRRSVARSHCVNCLAIARTRGLGPQREHPQSGPGSQVAVGEDGRRGATAQTPWKHPSCPTTSISPGGRKTATSERHSKSVERSAAPRSARDDANDGEGEHGERR